MKKIAVISDIHGNIEALEAVLKDIKDKDIQHIYCAGDLVGYGPRPNEVIEKIRTLRIPTVMGNYDEAVGFLLPACGCHNSDAAVKKYSANSLKWSTTHTTPRNREFLRELPERLELEVGGKKILLAHASLDSMNEYIYENDKERLMELLEYVTQDIYIYGHTHFPYVDSFLDKGKMVINAGSVGRPKNGDNRATYVVIDVEKTQVNATIYKVSYNIEKVAQEIEASGLHNYFADFLKSGGAYTSQLVYNSKEKLCALKPMCI